MDDWQVFLVGEAHGCAASPETPQQVLNFCVKLSQQLKSCAKRYHSMQSDSASKCLSKRCYCCVFGCVLHVRQRVACRDVPKKTRNKRGDVPKKHTQLKNDVLADPLRVRSSYLVQQKDMVLSAYELGMTYTHTFRCVTTQSGGARGQGVSPKQLPNVPKNIRMIENDPQCLFWLLDAKDITKKEVFE